MTLYIVDIEKQAGLLEFSNVYHVTAASVTAATTLAQTIVNYEKSVTYDTVTFVRIRIREAAVPGQVGTIVASSGTGAVAYSGSGTMLPYYCTTRVDFVSPGRRPSRKYLRGTVSEADQADGILVTAAITRMQTNYANSVAALSGVVNVHGEDITAGVVVPQVQMRQLRRKKRPTTP